MRLPTLLEVLSWKSLELGDNASVHWKVGRSEVVE